MKIENIITYTHKNVSLVDILRIDSKLVKLVFDFSPYNYIFNSKLFESKLCNYFLKSSIDYISRSEILNLKFNLHISKGKYLVPGVDNNEKIYVYHTSPNPNLEYVNFLDISSAINSTSWLNTFKIQND